MNIALNIFTNCTSYAPDTAIIKQTYDSFCDCFGSEYPVTVWMDCHPNVSKVEAYFENLRKIFPDVYTTNSLSEGYYYSVKDGTADFNFNLEHDWIFNKHLIHHSLEEICEIMDKYNLYHLRFNKRENVRAGWDTQIKEVEFDGFKFLTTNNISNNPHIIDRKRYAKDQINEIKIVPGSKGIEEVLNATGKYFGCIYGPVGYPATVFHTDGRKLDKVKRRKKNNKNGGFIRL